MGVVKKLIEMITHGAEFARPSVSIGRTKLNEFE